METIWLGRRDEAGHLPCYKGGNREFIDLVRY